MAPQGIETAPDLIEIAVTVNGSPRSAAAQSRRTLADFLRHDLGLTGTHVGCEHGVCGACTVLLDGEPVRSCLMFAVQARGSAIETVEGLADGPVLNPLQEELRAAHAFQCGFCTPGFLMSATALLRECTTCPSRAEIRDQLAGNICRCSGYQPIVDGVAAAARRQFSASVDPAGEEMSA